VCVCVCVCVCMLFDIELRKALVVDDVDLLER